MALQMDITIDETGIVVPAAYLVLKEIVISRKGHYAVVAYRTAIDKEYFHTTRHEVTYDQGSAVNLQTQVYTQLRALDEFATAVNV